MTGKKLPRTTYVPWREALLIGGTLLTVIASTTLALAPRGNSLVATKAAIGLGVAITLAGAALRFAQRRRMSRGLDIGAASRALAFPSIVALLVLAFAFSLWPIPSPYAWVGAVVPPVSIVVAVWLGLSLMRGSAPPEYHQARRAHQRGEDDTALSMLQALDEKRPDHYGTHQLWAMIHRQRGEYDDAHEACQRLLALRPDLYYGYAELGLTLLAEGRPAEACDSLEQAVRISPHLAEGHFNLGMACAEAQDFDKALASLSRALRLGMRDQVAEVMARYRLVEALQALGHDDRARLELSRLRRRRGVLKDWRSELSQTQGSSAERRGDQRLIADIEGALAGGPKGQH